MRTVLARVAIAVAAVILAACGGGGNGGKTAKGEVFEPATTQGTVSAGAPSAQSPESPSNSEVAQAPSTTRGPDLAVTGFTTPSGNIACAVGSSDVRCDIHQHDWAPPARPSNCDLEYGDSLHLSASGPAEFGCHGDTVFDPSYAVLQYGQRARQGSLVCDSEQAGVTCTGDTSGHGFFLSRGSYRLI